ncbi:MAG: LamG domain-containing protein [Nitrospirae bacterium]|nr:LamG domain-containing protein [Nitrospirota bacterium]
MGVVDAHAATVDSYTKLLLPMDGSDGSTTITDSTGKTVTNPESYDSYTKLMLHFNGTNGSTTFTDSATSKTVTANGNAQIDTAQSKFGGASGLFDGNGDYLTLADSDDWNFGSGDFTIDFWVRFNSFSGSFLLTKHAGASGYLVNYGQDSLSFYPESSYSGWYITGANFQTNTWYHIAFVRNGNSFYTFIDGVKKGTFDATGKNITGNTSASLLIGIYHTEEMHALDGSLDDLRISKGIARWTSDFTPPSYENGKVHLTTSQYKSGTASGVFDGSGSYLSLADSTDWDFGTGDFTIDGWIRFNSIDTTSNVCFMDSGSVQNDKGTFVYLNNGNNFHVALNGASNDYIFSWTPTTNTWYHVAATRSSGNLKAFINGVQIGSTQTANINIDASTYGVSIGARNVTPAYYFDGNLDDLRISKGIVRWTDTIAPTGSVSINSGASSTNSTSITLTLSASDDFGVTGYYISQP